MPKHVQSDIKSSKELKLLPSFSSISLTPSVFRCASSPLLSINRLSPAPLEGDVFYLVLRPLLEFLFQFVWCLFNAIEMEKCSSYNNNNNNYCFLALWLKKDKKRNVLLNVVQIALEMLCFRFFVVFF